MVQTPFPKKSLVKSEDFGTLMWALLVLLVKLVWRFQSPYGDFGNVQLEWVLGKNFEIVEFPSPYGDFGTPTRIQDGR